MTRTEALVVGDEPDRRRARDAVLARLRGRLVVSCQPVPGSPMDRPDIVAAYARAALDGGAAGVRIEGVENVRAVRETTEAPLIGLVKRDLDGAERITPWREDVEALADAGADVVAFDATRRARPVPVDALIAAVRECGCLSMADCGDAADGQAALVAGAEVLGSTLSGYTGGEVPSDPDLALVRSLRALTPHVFAEGRYNTPPLAARAIAAGAWAVVVGSAITRVEHVTGWFAEAVRDAATDAGPPS